MVKVKWVNGSKIKRKLTSDVLPDAVEVEGKKRKPKLKGKHKGLEEALFLWHQCLKGNGLPFIGPVLPEKALRFSQILEGEDSEFSEGFSEGFSSEFSEGQ